MESTVNQRVKELRTHLGISQQELAVLLDVTVVTISRIETGNNDPRKKLIDRLCKLYNVSEEWMNSGVGEMFAEGGSKVETKVSGWRDEAYSKLKEYNESLKQQNEFLQRIVNSLLPAQTQQKSFNNGADG